MIKKRQTAIVTGSAEGIGAVIAFALARRGLRVMCLDINDAENSAVAEKLREISPGHRAYSCDVSDPVQVSEVFDKIVKETGGIDILVNNAAVFSTMSFVEDTYENALADWERNINTNARSTFLCSKKAAPYMAQQKSGHIINIVTNHVKRYLYPPSSNEHSYDASKYAQLALNESLDCELKPYGIRVNAVCPAATRTPMLERFFEDYGLELSAETVGQCTGIPSLLEAEEVGEAVCHILIWDETQPTGQAILLVYSDDCEILRHGCDSRLTK